MHGYPQGRRNEFNIGAYTYRKPDKYKIIFGWEKCACLQYWGGHVPSGSYTYGYPLPLLSLSFTHTHTRLTADALNFAGSELHSSSLRLKTVLRGSCIKLNMDERSWHLMKPEAAETPGSLRV